MKNLFAYDFTNHTIVATKATLKKASNPTTDEYTALIKMIEGQPTFRVVEKTIKNSSHNLIPHSFLPVIILSLFFWHDLQKLTERPPYARASSSLQKEI